VWHSVEKKCINVKNVAQLKNKICVLYIMVCVLCEKKSVENWFGSFCSECRQIKNLGNVYGFERVLEILKKCCIRDENQLEKKIDNHKNNNTDESYIKTRSKRKKEIEIPEGFPQAH
tara:strand:+ start:206 stop:556 length:351 start_codon:yes stop_codon:yes gene_type:complete